MSEEIYGDVFWTLRPLRKALGVALALKALAHTSGGYQSQSTGADLNQGDG